MTDNLLTRLRAFGDRPQHQFIELDEVRTDRETAEAVRSADANGNGRIEGGEFERVEVALERRFADAFVDLDGRPGLGSRARQGRAKARLEQVMQALGSARKVEAGTAHPLAQLRERYGVKTNGELRDHFLAMTHDDEHRAGRIAAAFGIDFNAIPTDPASRNKLADPAEVYLGDYHQNAVDRPLLKPGMFGGEFSDNIKALQRLLVAAGLLSEDDVDGRFDHETREAVRGFQAQHGLAVDGVVGPNTWAVLLGEEPPDGSVRYSDRVSRGESRGSYSVREGDTLDRIAARHGITPEHLRRYNQSLPSQQRLRPGQQIEIPGTRDAPPTLAPREELDPNLDFNAYAPGRSFPPNAPETVELFRHAAELAGLPEEWAASPALHYILMRESNGVVGIPNYTYEGRKADQDQWEGVHDELRAGRISAVSSATGLGQLLLSNVDAYYPAGRDGIGVPLQEAAGMLNYIRDRYGTPEAAYRFYTDPNKPHEGY